ncbi:hypothetical protein [Maribellus sp. YY47]|nr:hypothetical protein [Maribellus sp. YY47]
MKTQVMTQSSPALENAFLVLRFCGKIKMKAAGGHEIIVNF